MLLLLLSSARAVQAMAGANHFLQKLFLSKIIFFPAPQYGLYNLLECYVKRLEKAFSQLQGPSLEQLLRVFRALQTSSVLNISTYVR